MCGLAGLILRKQETADYDIETVVSGMCSSIRHRGPDDQGVWLDREKGIALGHRRLSIIDLSAEGHQPMTSASGRYVIVYNGEVYNHRHLATKLGKAGHQFRGHSDTEIILAAIEQWGLDEAVKSFNGMFAFALWDQQAQQLHLARDRIGKKPLYFGWLDSAFVFASELKAIRAVPGFNQPIDRGALSLYMDYSCVPAPYSIYQGIYKLPPATILSLTHEQTRTALDLKAIQSHVREYWSVSRLYTAQYNEQRVLDTATAMDQLENLLLDAIESRMVADVPVGALLSGGIDSSLVVAMAQQTSSTPVNTFSIGFEERAYNEADFAGQTAAQLGTHHTQLFVTASDALDVIPLIPELYDEPFSGPSQIPTYLVSRLAREAVTVAITGDGGDESFGGYNRYTYGSKIWQRIAPMPLLLRRMLFSVLQNIRPQTWDSLFARAPSIFPSVAHPGRKIEKLCSVLNANDPFELYRSLLRQQASPGTLVIDGYHPALKADEIRTQLSSLPIEDMMAALDLCGYLPDNVLTKVDRASMGVSLEIRSPLLDYRVIELASKIPQQLKINNGSGKIALRKLLAKYLPGQDFSQPKRGFGAPVGEWIRGPLRDWAENLLDTNKLDSQAYFDASGVQAMWQHHLAGKRDYQQHLWSILIFQEWLDRQ